MTATRRDDVNRKYVVSKNIGKITSVIFYINFATALVTLILPNNIQEIALMFQVIMAISSVALSVIDDGIYWYAAERARRRNNIQTAFGIILDDYTILGTVIAPVIAGFDHVILLHNPKLGTGKEEASIRSSSNTGMLTAYIIRGTVADSTYALGPQYLPCLAVADIESIICPNHFPVSDRIPCQNADGYVRLR